MKTKVIVILLFIFCAKFCFAQSNYFQTNYFDTTLVSTKKWYTTDTGKSLIASGVLITLGMYTYKDEGFLNRKSIKEGINRYLPDFENNFDDYSQLIPYVGVYVLDAAGIKSKHKTLRKTTTIATGAILNLIVIHSLKKITKETRPDGSTNNSFPSGHTATAFMGAHIFHKEYGERSPYYSVGAYFLATVTGVFRQLNDKHWISDVFVGAGLGISLTELAYYLNGNFYKTNGLNTITQKDKKSNHNKPSFLGVKAGYASLTDSFNSEELGISSRSGFSLDIEGAYFFNKYIGIGGNIGIQSFPIKIDDDVQQEYNDLGYDIVFQSMGSSKYTLGPFLQFPFGKNSIGTKFLIGTAGISDTEVKLKPLESDEITEENYIIFAEIIPDDSLTWTTGIYYKRLISEKLTLGFYLDYNDTELNVDIRYIESITDGEPVYTSGRIGSTFDSYGIGFSVEVMLW